MFIHNEETWKKHSSPWSGWTRIMATPLLWHAVWLHNIYYFAVVVFFLAVNPWLFSAPKKISNWMSKAVIGEKIYTGHLIKKDTISTLLCVFMLFLFPLVIYSSFYNQLWMFTFSFGIKMTFKFWYLDRMVFLYEESRGNTVYRYRKEQ